MNKDKYVFSQLLEFLDYDKFRHLVDKYDGNKYVKYLTCWNQLLALMFGQLSNCAKSRSLAQLRTLSEYRFLQYLPPTALWRL